jgi:hypothetical protein
MSGGDEFGKSERPIDPAKTRSPEQTNASAGPHRKMQCPGVCPGVWTTSTPRPPSRSSSPSSIVRRSFTGCRGFANPAPQAAGSEKATASAVWT